MITIPDNIPTHADDPNAFAIYQADATNGNGFGVFDWLDSPGQGKYGRKGTIVVGGNVTDTFTFTLKNIQTGITCSTTLTLHFRKTHGKLGWTL